MDQEHALDLCTKMFSGLPADIPVTVEWKYNEEEDVVYLNVHGKTGIDPVRMIRKFAPRTEYEWEVDHLLFFIPDELQSNGHAVRMMRGSLEAYDEIKVTRLNVEANSEIGGYAWARYGFCALNPKELRASLKELIRKLPSSHPLMTAYKAAVDQEQSWDNDDEFLLNLASFAGPDGDPFGKKILKETRWNGYLDLNNEVHRERASRKLKEVLT